MFAQAPTVLLEIKVISAHDLPPVSRLLRTYVVASLDHDNRSKTAVDHHGGTNPTWNHKFVFCVDDKFFNSKTSEIKFEIYNVAWLRDLPMGTASLVISNIFPPLSPKNPTMRSVALRICRPMGHLQGILNVGVQLKGNSPPESEIGSQKALLVSNADKISKTLEQNDNADDGEYQIRPKERKTSKIMQKSDDMISSETVSLLESIRSAYEEKSLLSCTPDKSHVTGQELIGEGKGSSYAISNQHLLSHAGFIVPTEQVAGFVYEKDKSGTGLKSKMTHMTNGSVSSSGMHRLSSSSEVAGDYWGGDVEEDYLGSSIFETWIMAVAGDDREGETKTSKSLTWRTQDEICPVTGKEDGNWGCRRSLHRRSQSDGAGLFSFSGMKPKFICGSNSMDKKKGPSRREKMLDDDVDDHTVALFSW